MNNNFIKYYEQISLKIGDNKCTLILCNLISKYNNFPYRDLKVQDEFEFFFHYNQTTLLGEIGGFEIHTFSRKIKKLKQLDYIKYKNGYSPRCVLRRTTLWWLNLSKIRADFGIKFDTQTPQTDKATPPTLTSYTNVSKTSTPPQDTQTSTIPFNWNELNDQEKVVFDALEITQNIKDRNNLFNMYKAIIPNSEQKYALFNKCYPAK
jgi:hypothetical protein